jgi:hypothetical protein
MTAAGCRFAAFIGGATTGRSLLAYLRDSKKNGQRTIDRD